MRRARRPRHQGWSGRRHARRDDQADRWSRSQDRRADACGAPRARRRRVEEPGVSRREDPDPGRRARDDPEGPHAVRRDQERSRDDSGDRRRDQARGSAPTWRQARAAGLRCEDARGVRGGGARCTGVLDRRSSRRRHRQGAPDPAALPAQRGGGSEAERVSRARAVLRLGDRRAARRRGGGGPRDRCVDDQRSARAREVDVAPGHPMDRDRSSRSSIPEACPRRSARPCDGTTAASGGDAARTRLGVTCPAAAPVPCG